MSLRGLAQAAPAAVALVGVVTWAVRADGRAQHAIDELQSMRPVAARVAHLEAAVEDIDRLEAKIDTLTEAVMRLRHDGRSRRREGRR